MAQMKNAALSDRYDLQQERIFVSGSQAVIRLLLMQRERDVKAGLKTAGYVTGYRGSPLGGLDQQFTKAKSILDPLSILFQSGLNEDLAATAIWGTQQAELRGEGKHDGVFGLWYGKGPGVDRSGDAFRHANHDGTSKYGGVLALMGDDHTCESSTTAHQSEFAFVDAMIPILNPAGVQEIIDFGLIGYSLSRFAGLWVGLKCVKDNIEQSASVDGSIDRVKISIPDMEIPPGGLNIRLGLTPLEKESRLHQLRIPAVQAFARANHIDRTIWSNSETAVLGIVTTGKSYLDVREALDLLGIDESKAKRVGLCLYKVGMSWPLEPQGLKHFVQGLDRILVVEEKRALIETQIKEQLYNLEQRPIIEGKTDREGNALFQANGALEPLQIALAIGTRLLQQCDDPELATRVNSLKAKLDDAQQEEGLAKRLPYFCAGCPHNTSTVVPEGARAYAGIGCHYMAQWMNRSTEGFTQMGGEGANWIGEAPFSTRQHIYQNIGDGTYVHSGVQAIRAALAAGANMTFKVLYNDAVAMTGGQQPEGNISVERIASELAAMGVVKVRILSEQPDQISIAALPKNVSLDHRDQFARVQKELAEVKGVTVLIYDQTCAAEKRRRRKRHEYPDPLKRVLINELVCEGCGDCGKQSNCVAIQPVETEFGRKREIDQHACNKDYSCLKGFCPSFVTVHGGELHKGAEQEQRNQIQLPELGQFAEPELPVLEGSYSMLVTGVGGTGVVTLGAVMGMAAHLENLGVGVIDMSGLAQKGGAVSVHIRFAKQPEDIHAIRASLNGAELILGCDLVVTASDSVLHLVRQGKTRVVANSHEAMTANFTSDPDLVLPAADMKKALSTRAGEDNCAFVDATRTAEIILGDSIQANFFLLGYAWQTGSIPLSSAAIEKAIELNGASIEQNIHAFRWGRFAAWEPKLFAEKMDALLDSKDAHNQANNLEEAIKLRENFLIEYQNAEYAKRYRQKVEEVRAIEEEHVPGQTALTHAVARGLFKLMAYKDEYEVARLFTSEAFQRQLDRTFTGNYKIHFHLSPPILARTDPATGRPGKYEFGPWILPFFRLLTRFKGLRGTALDIFGYSSERKLERKMLADYEKLLVELCDSLKKENHIVAAELASLPEKIRGFGPVKKSSVELVNQRRGELMNKFYAQNKRKIAVELT